VATRSLQEHPFFGGFPSLENTFGGLIYARNQAFPGIFSDPGEALIIRYIRSEK
jgi:hypothetical protein